MIRFKVTPGTPVEDVATVICHLVYPGSQVHFEPEPNDPDKIYIGRSNNVWLYVNKETDTYSVLYRYPFSTIENSIMALMEHYLNWTCIEAE